MIDFSDYRVVKDTTRWKLMKIQLWATFWNEMAAPIPMTYKLKIPEIRGHGTETTIWTKDSDLEISRLPLVAEVSPNQYLGDFGAASVWIL